MPTSSYRRRARGSLLAPFDPWESRLCTCPFKLSLNPYTGCTFKCLYCYATAYIGLKDSAPKRDLLMRLKRESLKWPPSTPINIGTSSDPYPPEEAYYGLTRLALKYLVPAGWRILITTKGTLYASRDLDIISSGNVAVTPTITMLDPMLSTLIEPNAPLPEKRIDAVRVASAAGVPMGARVDPIIPYVNDDPYMLGELVDRLTEAGVVFIVTSTYKARPDNMARMRRRLGTLGERIYNLYKSRGVRVNGYIYLPKTERERLLRPVVQAARRNGLQYAHCREGLSGREWFNAPSCDGTHLIPDRVKPRGGGLDAWIR